MKLIRANEDTLEFNITISALSYRLNNSENLILRFEMIFKCVYEENTFNCRSNCSKESDPVIHKIQSPSKSFFVYTFYELTPNWQYKFRVQVLKPNFKGELHALRFPLFKIKSVLLTLKKLNSSIILRLFLYDNLVRIYVGFREEYHFLKNPYKNNYLILT